MPGTLGDTEEKGKTSSVISFCPLRGLHNWVSLVRKNKKSAFPEVCQAVRTLHNKTDKCIDKKNTSGNP